MFYSKNDAKLAGHSYRAKGEKLLLLDSEYADDTAILFDNCEDLTNGVNSIVTHFARFRMEVHTGKIESRGESKTEILFCSKPCSKYNNYDSYDNADLSDIIVSHDRYIPIVDHFSYLGSIISTSCTDNNDAEARIRKAGSLSKSIFSSPYVNRKVKAMVYISLILPILLHGSECWCLTERFLCKLGTFHHQCVRKMCNVTRLHTRILYIKTTDLLDSLLLDTIDLYMYKRHLIWAGHVFRMPWNRLSRKMLTSWVCSPRPRGCPKMTYGRSLKKSRKKSEINIETWHELALDRSAWKNVI